MLHLSLTGNLLCALDSWLHLYDYSVIPVYPGQMLVENIPLNLDRANKENLECFLQVRVDTCFCLRS
jgi:Ferritin-like